MIFSHLKIEDKIWIFMIRNVNSPRRKSLRSLVNWFGKSVIRMQEYLRASNTTSGEMLDFQRVRFFRKCSARDRTSEYTAMHANRGIRNIDVDRTSRQWWPASEMENFWRSRCVDARVDVSLYRSVVGMWPESRNALLTHFRCESRALSSSRELYRADRSIFARDGNMTKWFHLWKIHKLMSEMLQSDIYCQLYRGRFSRDIEIQNENAKVYV